MQSFVRANSSLNDSLKYLVFDHFGEVGIVVLELIEHAVVSTPEQANVRYVVEYHGPTLEAEAERPSNIILSTR